MLNVSTPSTTATGYSSTAEPNFLHPKRVLRSWYPIAQSRDVKRGKVLSVERLNRRLSIWRDQHGAVHVLDARCPHLGADLGQGRVVDDTLECPFHQWRWASDGHCSAARGWSEPPTRRTRSYPVQNSGA